MITHKHILVYQHNTIEKVVLQMNEKKIKGEARCELYNELFERAKYTKEPFIWVLEEYIIQDVESYENCLFPNFDYEYDEATIEKLKKVSEGIKQHIEEVIEEEAKIMREWNDNL